MHGELIPAAVAAGAGGGLIGAIALRERAVDAAMRASRETYSVVFPLATTPAAAVSGLRSLAGSGLNIEIVAEMVADEDGIHHLLHIPERMAGAVIDHIAAAMPGVRLDVVEARSTGETTAVQRLSIPQKALLRTDEVEQAARALLNGLGALRARERVSLRWALRPWGRVETQPAVEQRPMSLRARAEQRAWRERLGEPGCLVSGLLLVRAESVGRARALEQGILAVLRGRRGVGSGVMVRRGRLRPAGSAMPATGRSRGWLSAPEIVGLLGWPLGNEAVAGVQLGAARRLPVPRGVPADGRRLFTGRDAYGTRSVALSAEAARHHLAVVGPSGTGKSVLLARGILDDLACGYGGVVIDPKADLVADVLERVPRAHEDRVVVLDPSEAGPVPGVNVLSGGDPDLRSDVLVGALRALFPDWGIRNETYLRLGLRTLSEVPGATIADIGRLFFENAYRHAALQRLRDPMLISAWQTYEALNVAERQQHVQAPMARVMALLTRPAVRRVIAQPDPKLDITRLLAEGKWLLVSLSPGVLGEPAVRLLGSLLTYAVWASVEGRARTTPDERRPVFLYVDELQTLTDLPFGIEHLFERARGLGCGVTVATQALGRLPESIRQSLLGNVGSLVTFRLGYEEATRLARELPGLAAQDLQSLRQFEVAARVSTGRGSGIVTVTGTAEPLPRATRRASRIRRLSATRYGQELPDVRPVDVPQDTSLGRKRRAS